MGLGLGRWSRRQLCSIPSTFPLASAIQKLTERVRALYPVIMAQAQVGIGIADVARIDRDNILAATLWAMGEAVRSLTISPSLALVDGNRAPALPCPAETIIEGDGRSLSIAAASIIAKVTRDRTMVALDAVHPGYGFARHKGYGTAEHQTALSKLGPCPAHRISFAPVKKALQPTDRCRGHEPRSQH